MWCLICKSYLRCCIKKYILRILFIKLIFSIAEKSSHNQAVHVLSNIFDTYFPVWEYVNLGSYKWQHCFLWYLRCSCMEYCAMYQTMILVLLTVYLIAENQNSSLLVSINTSSTGLEKSKTQKCRYQLSSFRWVSTMFSRISKKYSSKSLLSPFLVKLIQVFPLYVTTLQLYAEVFLGVSRNSVKAVQCQRTDTSCYRNDVQQMVGQAYRYFLWQRRNISGRQWRDAETGVDKSHWQCDKIFSGIWQGWSESGAVAGRNRLYLCRQRKRYERGNGSTYFWQVLSGRYFPFCEGERSGTYHCEKNCRTA